MEYITILWAIAFLFLIGCVFWLQSKLVVADLQIRNLTIAGEVAGQSAKLLEDTHNRFESQLHTLEDEIETKDDEIETLEAEVKHQKGRAQSAHSSKGQILEKWTPFLEHPQIEPQWKPEDWSFMGNPLDYVVWEWYKDKDKNLAEGKIVLLDVKAAKSQLTTKQRRIRDLIKAGNVEWREIRLD